MSWFDLNGCVVGVGVGALHAFLRGSDRTATVALSLAAQQALNPIVRPILEGLAYSAKNGEKTVSTVLSYTVDLASLSTVALIGYVAYPTLGANENNSSLALSGIQALALGAAALALNRNVLHPAVSAVSSTITKPLQYLSVAASIAALTGKTYLTHQAIHKIESWAPSDYRQDTLTAVGATLCVLSIFMNRTLSDIVADAPAYFRGSDQKDALPSTKEVEAEPCDPIEAVKVEPCDDDTIVN
jgi:hypothetical protein